MKATITPSELHGSVKAVASKSMAHRLLICAALADRPTEISCEESSEDIEATAESLNQMGADITYDRRRGIFHARPVCRCVDGCVLDVGESGSTLRFLLPVACALGMKAHIRMRGRLGQRPLSPLWEELERHGCSLTRNPDGSIDLEGRLSGGEFHIAANVSSQFVSGLLFALPLVENPSCIRLSGTAESTGYIQMTIWALEQFGICTIWDGDILTVSDKPAKRDMNGRICAVHDRNCGMGYLSPGMVRTEGDWSNGAFWEIAGMLAKDDKEKLICTGLEEASAQGDRVVRQLKFQVAQGNAVVDSRDIPDLVPILSVLASVAPGSTTFTHAERLRLKESDRIRATVNLLRALGGQAEETTDGLIVHGMKQLRGGCVDSCHDHRIAMSAAIASIVCKDKVVITGAEAVSKSYPSFWEDFRKLGGKIVIEP